MKDNREPITIVTTFNEIKYIAEAIRFEWPSSSDRTMISNQMLEDLLSDKWQTLSPGDVFDIGPFRVKVTRHLVACDAIEVVRQGSLLSKIKYFYHRSIPTIDLIYRRAIITLAVWRLATCETWELPTWRDVKIFKKR